MLRKSDVENEEIRELSKRGWHLDKSINLPFLLAVFMASFAGVGYIITQDRRQTKSETKIENLENNMPILKSDLKTDLMRIETKLDRIIENGHNNNSTDLSRYFSK